jgi:hypothetical protein
VGNPAVDVAYTGLVMSCPLSGCGTTPTTIWSQSQGTEGGSGGNDGPYGIAVDASNVYWSNMIGAGDNFPPGSVMQLALP